MSTSVGKDVPDQVVVMLGGEQADEQVGKVILLLTVDEQGFPHAAQLSPGEILIRDKSFVRLAVFKGGRTLRNIADRSALALVIIEPELSCYIKGRGSVSDATISRGSTQPFEAVRVDVAVEDVLLDSEAGAAITTGTRYSRDVPAQQELGEWSRVWSVLGDG